MVHTGIGLPQVAFIAAGQTAVEWIDVYHRLSVDGIFLLSSRTSAESVTHLIGNILYATGNTDRVLGINGSGGDTFSGSSVVDCILGDDRFTTLVLGTSRSVAAIITLAGSIRYGLVHCRLVLHSAEAWSSGTIHLMQRVTKHFSRLTGSLQRSLAFIPHLKASERYYLTANAACNLGMLQVLSQASPG